MATQRSISSDPTKDSTPRPVSRRRWQGELPPELRAADCSCPVTRRAGKDLGRDMLRWPESRIDPFQRPATEHPPRPLWAFYWHVVEPVWAAFVRVLVLDLLAALTEVALAKFVADLID